MEEANEENLRFKFCLWHRSTIRKSHNLAKRAYCRTKSSRMCYSPAACCIALSFPLRFHYFFNTNWIVSSDHSSINMSVASLLQMRIVPLFFLFFEAIFLPAKSTRFSTPEPWLSWSVMTLGTRIPLVSARGPLVRRAETTS